MLDILSMTAEEIGARLDGEPKFRVTQIMKWLHEKRCTNFNDMKNIPKILREKLSVEFFITSLKVRKVLVSSSNEGEVKKFLYRLADGNYIETVLMKYEHGYSLCVSTQVGCRMGCKFCASGTDGLTRNLEPSEILSQLYETERNLGQETEKRISTIVLMGIGEPLDNFGNVTRFLQLLADYADMSMRNIALSTCGIVPRINELAELRLGLTLCVSLHSTNNIRRGEIMPVNKAYNIEELMEAVRNYAAKTSRRVTVEFAVGADMPAETAREEAHSLIRLLRGMNKICHVNLLPLNSIECNRIDGHGNADVSGENTALKHILKTLRENGINATVRRSLGRDIDAACGQLKQRTERKEKCG